MLYANQGRLAASPFPLSSYPEAVALSVFSQIKGAVSRQSSPICFYFSNYSPLLATELNVSEEINGK